MDVLIVDDQIDVLRTMTRIAEQCGYDVTQASTVAEAQAIGENRIFHIIVLDIHLPDGNGIELMRSLRKTPSLAASDYILVTGLGDMDTAIRSFRRGAYDFITKPIHAEDFAATLRRAADHQALLRANQAFTQKFDETVRDATVELREEYNRARDCIRKLTGVGEIVAASKAMREALDMARQCHENPDVPVLIEGDTGAGKEMIARLIHYGEAGIDTPFVDISCAAIPHALFESEFFGHEPGAFTGSKEKGHAGKLEQADSGSVLLDDISDMPLEFQSKMLRVLQERTFYRVGGAQKQDFRARVIATSNRNLEEMAESGDFRRDLLHRIRFAHIQIPPLRERPEDIEAVAQLFLQREAKARKKRFQCFSQEAMDHLLKYSWPGNIRELEGAICRVALCNDGVEVTPEHLAFLGNGHTPASVKCDEKNIPGEPSALLDWFREGRTLDDLTSELIDAALDRFDGNQSEAARHLGISRYLLRRRMQ